MTSGYLIARNVNCERSCAHDDQKSPRRWMICSAASELRVGGQGRGKGDAPA